MDVWRYEVSTEILASHAVPVDMLFPGGPKAALVSATACGILLGVFEGVGVLISRTMGEANRQVAPPRMFPCLLCQGYSSLSHQWKCHLLLPQLHINLYITRVISRIFLVGIIFFTSLHSNRLF